jgi:protein-S-isoprenylcysteine O-methyltransferase
VTPHLPLVQAMLGIVLFAELYLMRSRLSKDTSRTADRGSLRLLMAIIFISVGLAWVVARRFPQARFDALFDMGPAAVTGVYAAGIAVFVAGLALRWYAMAYLGRLFTFDVAIAADHQVIDTGPYRHIRHPAYTGSLMTFVGIGLCGGNALALVVLLVPIVLAFMRRIAVEEAALTAGLGGQYVDYVARTKRLIPFVY